MIRLHQAFCDYCPTIEGESELSRNWRRIIYQPTTHPIFVPSHVCTDIQGISALVLGGWGSIGQSRFICQVLCTGILDISALVLGRPISQSRFICQGVCTGIQGISALVLGGWGSIGQSRFICQVLCTGNQGISALVLVGLSPREGSSAKFDH